MGFEFVSDGWLEVLCREVLVWDLGFVGVDRLRRHCVLSLYAV